MKTALTPFCITLIDEPRNTSVFTRDLIFSCLPVANGSPIPLQQEQSSIQQILSSASEWERKQFHDAAQQHLLIS